MAAHQKARTVSGPRAGDRVVAIAEVGRSRIVIHGHGTYQCTNTGEVPETLVERVRSGVQAADAVLHDFEPWLRTVCAPMPTERAERTERRLIAADVRRRSTHALERAQQLVGTVRRERRVVLERGGVIDADTCWLVMRSDAFIACASGSTVSVMQR
jgi:hypothetical protein